MAGFDFPLRLPGAAAALLAGGILYYLLGAAGILSSVGISFQLPGFDGIGLLLPIPQAGGFLGMFGDALRYLPLAAPFCLLVITQAININESVRLAGDNYNTREIILVDAFATLAAGCCGGVAQSTPYFGHSAYKKMGARAAYTLATGLIVGLGGMLGLIGFFVDLIPAAVVKPILILIGFDMVRLSFQMTPDRHAMAVIIAMVPSILNYAYTQVKTLFAQVQSGTRSLRESLAGWQDAPPEGLATIQAQLDQMVSNAWIREYIILGALGQGFILTAMIWGAMVAFTIDARIGRAALTMAIAVVFSLFGLIHSVYPTGDIYLPWHLRIDFTEGLYERSLAMHFLGPNRKRSTEENRPEP